MALTSTTFSLEQAIDLCLQSDSKGNSDIDSDIDSETRGLTTDEEQELDEQLTKKSESEREIK